MIRYLSVRMFVVTIFITLLNTPSLAAGTKAVVYYRCYGIRIYKPQCI